MTRRITVSLICVGLAAALLVLGLLAGFVPQSEGPEVRRRVSGVVARLRPEDIPAPIMPLGDGVRQWAVRGPVAPPSAADSAGGDVISAGGGGKGGKNRDGGPSSPGAAGRRIVGFGPDDVHLDTGGQALAFKSDAQGDFAPLLALDGVSMPLLLVNQPRQYGDALDDSGRPLRWLAPQTLLSGYSQRTVRKSVIQVLRHEAERAGLTEDIDDNDTEKLLERARRYQRLVENFARRYNLSTDLVYAIIHSESDFSPTLVSSKSAMGLMQVVPDTSGDEVHRYLYGRAGNIGFEDLRVPETNIRYGTTYLHILFTRYLSGVRDPLSREYCAIASYNMGPNGFLRLYGKTTEEAVERINSMSSEALFKDLCTRLPARETRYYILRVQKMKEQYSALR